MVVIVLIVKRRRLYAGEVYASALKCEGKQFKRNIEGKLTEISVDNKKERSKFDALLVQVILNVLKHQK